MAPAPTLEQVNRLRGLLREREAALEATQPKTALRREIGSEVHELRGIWREAETVIGRRTSGMAIANSSVDLLDTHKLTQLTRGYKNASKRNTGKPISGDLADFEARVQQAFGYDPDKQNKAG